MQVDDLSDELIAGGLDETLVNRLLQSYTSMRRHLRSEQYEEVGTHVGNFCETVVNICRIEMGEDVQDSVEMQAFVNRCLSDGFPESAPDEIRLTIPRIIRAAYQLRSTRDTVHSNLSIPVNHLDSRTAVQLCTWTLAELLRLFGPEEDIDAIARTIDDLARPMTPLIDEHNGRRVIMDDSLETEEEILVHLHLAEEEVSADDLAEWIIGVNKLSVTGSLGSLKSRRLVHYDNGSAKITGLGDRRAIEILEDSDVDFS